MTTNDLAYLLVMLSIFVLLFLALRRLVWWYWGISKHLANQQAIIDLLTKQIELQQIIENQAARRRSDSTQPASQSHQPQSPTRRPNPLQP